MLVDVITVLVFYVAVEYTADLSLYDDTSGWTVNSMCYIQ